MRKAQVSYFILFLTSILLSSLDIKSDMPQQNNSSPLRDSQSETRYPFGTCENSVDFEQQAVACDKCGQWFHLGCQELSMNTQEYEELGKNNDSWYCIICNNVNYSTIVFSLHGLTASPTTNSSLDLDTSTSSTFNPLHTSTPTRASRQDKQKRRPLRFNLDSHSR